jgi:hypothetical protein
MHPTQGEFLETVAAPLAWYYVAAALMNVGAAWYAWRRRKRRGESVAWLVFAVGFALLAWKAVTTGPLALPESLKNRIDASLGPITFTLGAFAIIVIFYAGRRFFVRPAVAWSGLNVWLVFMGASMTDPEFAQTVTKPDNVPIVAMFYLLAFFTWLGAAQAVKNDDRLSRGQGPIEKDYSDTVLVWPDVIYAELIGLIIATVVLVVWSLLIRAPLEAPANPVVTPNPSKAPWYFLGLQDMLGYFDPAIAGVILPTLIIFGLMAIPYIDPNPNGNGYYTIAQRRFSYLVFLFGFLGLWILLILIGTLMRGPNWSFFGLYEPRDPHKMVAATNTKLSEYFWVIWLGRGLPQVPVGAGVFRELGLIVWREIAGLALVSLYFVGLPMVLGRTLLHNYRIAMGRARYWVMILLLLMMLMLPLKMVLNWTMALSYIVSIPEYSFNF